MALSQPVCEIPVNIRGGTQLSVVAQYRSKFAGTGHELKNILVTISDNISLFM